MALVVALALALGAAGCTGPHDEPGPTGGGEPVSDVLPLVPAPLHAERVAGDPFAVSDLTAVVYSPGAEQPAELVAAALGTAAGRQVPVRPALPGEATGASGGAIFVPGAATSVPGEGTAVPDEGTGALVVLALSDDATLPEGDEAYSLTAGADGVRLTARTVAGLFPAAATLTQLVVTSGETVTVPAVEVSDAPRYPWRGLMVDVARHFLPVADLEVVVDLLARYKLNVLHLHLTDDQGWRIDVPSYPELVERSSGGGVNGDAGGCYTAGDWAALVAYAAARGVTVVPEIDVPGHTNAALHAIPALNLDGVAPDVYQGIEVGFSTLRADLPATGPFLANVFGDVAAMTPGEYLHVGGDEAKSTADDEYACLVCTAVDDVRAAGKQVVGWQEIAKAQPLPAGTVLQYWDERADPAPVLAAAAAGAKVLMSPASRVYLDMKYTPATALGQDWAGLSELRDSYDWDPDTELASLDSASVVGVEAAVWTETLSTLADVTYMLLPRLAAVGEVAWSASSDWGGFRERVAAEAAAWDRAGLTWYMSPQVAWRR